MRREPAPDGLHRHVLGLDLAALDQDASDRGIGMAVGAGVADSHLAAVGQTDAARSLDVQEERIGRVVDPDQLEAAPGERPAIDPCARGERIEAAVRAAKGEGKLPEAAAKAFGDMDGNASFAAYVELRGLLKGLTRLGGVDTVDLLQGAPISCWAQRKSDGRTRIVSIHLDAAGLAEIATR